MHVLDLLLQRRRDYPVLFNGVESLEFRVLNVHLEHGTTSPGNVLHDDLIGLERGTSIILFPGEIYPPLTFGNLDDRTAFSSSDLTPCWELQNLFKEL